MAPLQTYMPANQRRKDTKQPPRLQEFSITMFVWQGTNGTMQGTREKAGSELRVFYVAFGVHAQEDEQQNGESPERTATVGKEGQRDADDGRQAQHHADVDE